MTPEYKKFKRNFYHILIGILLINVSIVNSSYVCNSKLNCGDCIRTLNCSWCVQENFPDESRCFEIQPDLNNTICPENYTINPISIPNILQNDELTRIELLNNKEKLNETKNPNIVQIKPQKISLKLKPNEVSKISFEYSKAEDYPLDLYYLMDLSSSMKIHKSKLSSLGTKFAIEMRKITRNFRLGFGSFVDKVIMPFTSVSADNLKNPCHDNPDMICDPPYSFKHVMSLNSNENLFSKKVDEANISKNIDSAEGGFDALMQVMVCHDKIGWREDARRLIVFSTDSLFHVAGDGKLAGIIEPNDGICHMDNNNKYTHAEILDYPSVFHINEVAKNNSINMIFAVTSNVRNSYTKLASTIQGATFGIITKKSDNVVDLIKRQYNQITSSVEIKDNAKKPIKTRYFTSCLNANDTKEQNKCNDLKDDSVIKFDVEISFSECPPKKKNWKQTFNINPVGIHQSLEIDLEMICDCDCENYEENSTKCEEHGTYECGICKCNEGYSGKKCECLSDIDFSQSSTKNCKQNKNDLIDCNNRGTCRCGECKCDERENSNEIYSGRYCECDNFSCPRLNNIICSGEDHGICECGMCRCNTGWDGPACNCSTSEKACYPSTGEAILCSGHGKCECGKCNCQNRYHGKFCETCSTCQKLCKNLENCVECKVYKTGPLKDECLKNCAEFQIDIIDNIGREEDDENYNENDWQLCKSIDKNFCEFMFEYEIDNPSNVRSKKGKICQDNDSALKIAGYVILAILALGIFTLILWKLIIAIHDKREYTRFEQESLDSKWDDADNPLYIQATSLYKNPAFHRSSVYRVN